MQIKTLIAAPFLEELMYRGIIFGLYRDSGIFNEYPIYCLILLPFYFAIAHAHSLWDQRNLQWS